MKTTLRRFSSVLAIAAGALLLSACGKAVEVPPAHVGMISTKDGYQENLIPTSKFRLDKCWGYCDRLVTLDVADKPYKEDLNIFIPGDQLNLGVTVQSTLSINPKKTLELFKAVAPEPTDDDQLSRISAVQVYKTYASQIIQKEARELLSQYTIAQIASSNEKLNAELAIRLENIMAERTPFNVRFVGITKLDYPKIITDAQEASAERREAIQKEEAQTKVSEAQLDRQLKEARLQRAIEKEKAETEALAQRVLSQAVDANVLKLRQLEIEKTYADATLLAAKNWDGKQPTTVTTLGGDSKIPLLLTMPAQGK